ncbi:hypothetical protein LTR17_023442 [Elasticomyces elasticus]|nr:hypothetical protein LTR17_023442 [Elasticomyces elasticus]
MDEKQGFTYRVEYVPNGMSKHVLRSLFHPEDAQHLEIRSLTPDVNNYDGTGCQVATAYYSPPSQQRELRLRDQDSELVLGRAFLGFTPLNETVEAPTADSIAVTGLAGHAFGSWAHTRRRMWLRDYLPGDIQRRARVLVYGYNSQVQGHDTPTSILADHGNRFVNDLLRIRTHAACRDRPLILIGHSLGGLIIKQALADLAPGLRSMLPVKRVVFLGVPNGGLDQMALADIVRGHPPQELIAESKRNSPTLRGLAQRFKSNCSDLVVHTYYESRMTNTVVQIKCWDEGMQSADGKLSRCGPPVLMVDGTSAILHHSCEVSVVSVDGNHSEIAKLQRGQGGAYVDIKAHVEDALQHVEQTHKLLAPSNHSRSASPWRFDASEGKPTRKPPNPTAPRAINSAAARKDKAEHDAENREEASCKTQCLDSDATYSDHSGSCRSAFCLGGALCRLENDDPKPDVTPRPSKASVQKEAETCSCPAFDGTPHFAIYQDYDIKCSLWPESELNFTPSSSNASTVTVTQPNTSAEPQPVVASAFDFAGCGYSLCVIGPCCPLQTHRDLARLERSTGKPEKPKAIDHAASGSAKPTVLPNASGIDIEAFRKEYKSSSTKQLPTPTMRPSALSKPVIQDQQPSSSSSPKLDGKATSRFVTPNELVAAASSVAGNGALKGVTAGPEQLEGSYGRSGIRYGWSIPASPDHRLPSRGIDQETTKPRSPWRIIARAAINAYLDVPPAKSTPAQWSAAPAANEPAPPHSSPAVSSSNSSTPTSWDLGGAPGPESTPSPPVVKPAVIASKGRVRRGRGR